ncbi:MAG: hypothetical protein LBK06_04725 [Planctomycetaceae bacterium]|jgi:hypothetical protein|nr:hypothetical protein [Planctomycetaceae bacterium]
MERVLYTTKWSDGSHTLSIYKFQDVDYTESKTGKSSKDDTSGYRWNIGTAQEGRKESDYTFNTIAHEYQLLRFY